jgi:hypothetical protein
MLQFTFAAKYQDQIHYEQNVVGQYLRFAMALEIDSGIQCGFGLKSGLIIATNEPSSILSLTWSGEARARGTRSFAEIEFIKDPKDSITQIIYNVKLNIFGLLTLKGDVYLCKFEYPTPNSKITWTGSLIYTDDSPATMITFNDVYGYISIGDQLGIVSQYEISKENTVTAVYSHGFAIKIPGNKSSPSKLGAVSVLSWTSDGYALAVGWLYGGFSVWSIYGCILTSTISEDTYIHSSDGIISETKEAFFTGVQDLFWEDGDLSLFILPTTSFVNGIEF